MDIITGATGLLGNALIRELLSRGRNVKAMVRKSSDTACFNDCEVEKVFGDILDFESLKKAFSGVEYVYHLASEISILPGMHKRLREINITGTDNVIKACFECGVKRLIYTSSIHAYKESKNGTIIDETLPFDPYNRMGEYNRTKARASLAVLEAVRQGLDAVIVCPTGVMGPYDFKVSNMGSMFIDYCRGKQKIIIDGAFDFVDTRDVAIGHILAAQKGTKGQSYMLSGQRVTMGELMLMLKDVTGIPLPKYKLPVWIAYPVAMLTPIYYRVTGHKPVFTIYSLRTLRSNSFISHKKATEELGYNPRPVRQTIKESINWLKKCNLF
jgi:Nucleoside-diphosphate-sugar epimerases